MEEIDGLEILQLHYFLSEHSHSMDAKIYNKVETELLKIFDEVARVLNLEISIEIQALEEGGLRAIYTFLNKKKNRRKTLINKKIKKRTNKTKILKKATGNKKINRTKRLKNNQPESINKQLKVF